MEASLVQYFHVDPVSIYLFQVSDGKPKQRVKYGPRYSRMDQVKFVEESL